MSNQFQELLQLAMFGSLTWFVAMSTILLFLLFYSEHEKEGGIAFLSLTIYLILNYWWGNLPVIKFVTWTSVIIYFGIGLFYSILRVFFFGRSLNKFEEDHYKGELKENVFRWWFMWPISFLYWGLSKGIQDLYNLIYDKISFFFNWVVKIGFNTKTK